MASDKAELRGLAHVNLVKALDALAQADGMDRNEYVNKVLDLHVKSECRRLTLGTRMLRGNPYLSEADAGGRE